jgi:hypothetical protein
VNNNAQAIVGNVSTGGDTKSKRTGQRCNAP